MVQEDGHRVRPTFDKEEKRGIERANQVFLRLRKTLHDREEQPTARDIEEAAQGARSLSGVLERYQGELETAYEDALAASGLPEEDQDHLRKGTEEAGGFSSFVMRDLGWLEEAAPGEGTGGRTAAVDRETLACCVTAGLLAGGTMMGNSFYFGFAVGMSRKAGCW